MTGRLLLALLTSVSLAGCGRNTSEEPFLTPPPPIASPEAGVETPPPAARPAAAPAPAPVAPTPVAAPTAAAPQIRASHLLVMYQGSMRAPATITRTKVEARARAQVALARIQGGADFAAVAREFSDDPSSGGQGGDLGRFGRTGMVAPFSDAAFALQPGQVSGIVETPFGFHIIKRTE